MTTKTLKDIGKLGVLLLVLGGILYYNNRTVAPTAAPTASAPPPSKPAARDKSGTPLAPTDGSVMDVKLDLLAAQTDSYGPPQRDPFRFKPKPVPVVKAAPPPPVVVVTQPLVRPTPPQPPQGDSPERLIRYSGYIVNASGRAVAVMSFGLPSSPTVQIYGTEGDIIEGRFRLQRIEPNAIEVSELSGEGRRARISRQ